jgi:hypothetical protein
MRHCIRIRTVCGEGLTKLLRSTCVCLDSICDSFHKSRYFLFLFFCRRIPTSQLTILQNLKQFKLVNLYLQGFEDWSCGHWHTYLTYLVPNFWRLHFNTTSYFHDQLERPWKGNYEISESTNNHVHIQPQNYVWSSAKFPWTCSLVNRCNMGQYHWMQTWERHVFFGSRNCLPVTYQKKPLYV